METFEIVYHEADSDDEMMEREQANYLEHGLNDIYLTSNFQQKSTEEMAKVCVEIVKAWLELYTEQERESFNS